MKKKSYIVYIGPEMNIFLVSLKDHIKQ